MIMTNTLSYFSTPLSIAAIILLDYVLAFMVLGLGGVFRRAGRSQGQALGLAALLTCALRLVIFPAAILLLRLTPLPEMVVSSVFLCTAMPCAALTAMQAERYDCEKELASRGVALSTALSMATVPLMLLLV